MTSTDLVGKLRIVFFGHFDALLGFSLAGYAPDVAEHSVIGLGNPSDCSATAPLQRFQTFFTTAN